MITRVRVIGVVAAASVLMVGCGSTVSNNSSAGGKGNPVTISFDAMEYSSASNQYFPKFVKEFEALHPNIKVNLKVINWSAGQQVLNTEIGGGHPPDVAIIGTRWLPGYVNDGLIQPLTKFLTPSMRSQFYPAALDSLKYKGVQDALPEAMSVRLLIYNKKLFTAAGISTPPKTWTQLSQDAAKIHQATGQSGYALVGSQVETSLDYWYTMWGFGGHILSGHTATATAPGDVKALQYLVNLIHQGGTEPNVTASTRVGLESVFASGKIGMMIDGPWLVKEALANHVQVGVASLPSQPGVPQRNPVITDSFVMFKNKHEQASWEFMKFMFSKPVRTLFDQTEGMLPTMKTVGSETVFRNSPVFSPYLKALKRPAVYEPVVPGFQSVSLAYTNAVESAYSGALSPRSALQQANAKVTAALTH